MNKLLLKLDPLSIYYAAAYLCIIRKRWEKAGYPINDKPEIMGTLYSTGLFYLNGEKRKPNQNPQANEFGASVLKALNCYFRLDPPTDGPGSKKN